MRIPRSIYIKGEKWKIQQRAIVEDDEGNKCYGICHFSERVILLEKGMSKELEAETFVHEVMHASLYEMHMSIDRALEEQIIDGLAYTVINLFDINVKSARRK